MLLHLLTRLRDRLAPGGAPQDRGTARLGVRVAAPRTTPAVPLPLPLRAWIDRRRAGLRWGLAVLPRARREFVDMLADIDGPPARALEARIVKATSLRSLWHLRTELLAVVSQQRDLAEASRRVARLGRHFPSQAPRAGAGPVDALARSATGEARHTTAPSRTEHQAPETGR